MFKVTARTVLELGSELISSDAIAFYELIKNGIDAGSKNGVTINFDIILGRRDYEETKAQIVRAIEEESSSETDLGLCLDELKYWLSDKLNTEASELWHQADALIDNSENCQELLDTLETIDDLNSITISDTGSGMSLRQLETVFLVIGTSSKKNKIDAAIAKGESRPPFLGEKGIGRLSAMRLGDQLSVRTATTRSRRNNCIDIDWSAFDNPTRMIEDIVIQPWRDKTKPEPGYSGTNIVIRKLNADWSEKRVDRLAMDDFSLLVNPLGPAKGQRIAVFWNGKRVNIRRLEKTFLSHANAVVRGNYRVTNDGPALGLRIELSNIGFPHPQEISVETVTADILHGALVGPQVKRRRMHKRDIDYAALNSVGAFDFKLHWFNRSILRKGKSTGEYQALRNLLKPVDGCPPLS